MSVSVGFSSSLYLFTSVTVRLPVHAATKTSRNLSDMKRSTFKIDAAQLRSVTVIALKSPFLPESGSPLRFGFRVDTTAIWGGVNI